MEKTLLNDLKTADLKDSYEIHWASVMLYGSIGDRRICPNCKDIMTLSDDNWLHWGCNNCCRIEYLAVFDADEKRLPKPYWFIDCSVDKKETLNPKFWE